MSFSWLGGRSTPPTTPTALNAASRAFASRTVARNRRETVAALIVAVIFGLYVVLLPRTLSRVGAALVVVAAAWVISYLRRHGSVATNESTEAQPGILLSYQRQLERQRDLLSRAWLWYVTPFVPGMVLILKGAHAPGRFYLIMALILASVAVLNRVGAMRLQHAIEKLPTEPLPV